jgi:hypothetical protein
VHNAFCIVAFFGETIRREIDFPVFVYVGSPFDELGTRGKKERFRLGLIWRVPRLKHNQESWR